MKTLIALTVLTLICLLHGPQVPVTASKAAGYTSQKCCVKIRERGVPAEKIKTMRLTKVCKKKVFLVTTVCDKDICLRRHSEQAERLWVNFEMYTVDKTSSPVKFNVSLCGE